MLAVSGSPCRFHTFRIPDDTGTCQQPNLEFPLPQVAGGISGAQAYILSRRDTMSARVSWSASATMVAPQARTAGTQLARGKSLRRPGQHGQVVGLVPGAVDVLAGDAQPLRQPGHHAALGGASGGDLQQRPVREEDLILPRPGAGTAETP